MTSRNQPLDDIRWSWDNGLWFAIGTWCSGGAPQPLVIDIAVEAFHDEHKELSTLAQYNLPVKMFIINNEWMGMVRQWQELIWWSLFESYSASLPALIKLADTSGMVGLVAKKPDDLDGVIAEMLATPGPVIADIRVAKEENCFPMIPSGAAHNEMLDQQIRLKSRFRGRHGIGIGEATGSFSNMNNIDGIERHIISVLVDNEPCSARVIGIFSTGCNIESLTVAEVEGNRVFAYFNCYIRHADGDRTNKSHYTACSNPLCLRFN